jgi:hypothetical protein
MPRLGGGVPLAIGRKADFGSCPRTVFWWPMSFERRRLSTGNARAHEPGLVGEDDARLTLL